MIRNHVRLLYLITVMCVTFANSPLVWAAIPKNPTALKVLTAPTAVIGGISGVGYSILNVKKELNKQAKYERLIIDIGDLQGKRNLGLPAYYHAQFTKDPARLVLDFAQVPVSKISQLQLQNILKGSQYVRHSRLLKDPSDGSMTVILDLKPSTKIRVMQVKGVKDTSKVVVDLL